MAAVILSVPCVSGAGLRCETKVEDADASSLVQSIFRCCRPTGTTGTPRSPPPPPSFSQAMANTKSAVSKCDVPRHAVQKVRDFAEDGTSEEFWSTFAEAVEELITAAASAAGAWKHLASPNVLGLFKASNEQEIAAKNHTDFRKLLDMMDECERDLDKFRKLESTILEKYSFDGEIDSTLLNQGKREISQASDLVDATVAKLVQMENKLSVPEVSERLQVFNQRQMLLAFTHR